MLAAVLFYSVLFVMLVVLPALVILVFLFFIDHERRLWKRIGPVVTPALKRFIDRPSVQRLRQRYPTSVSFIARRLNPHDPWGLPATMAIVVVALGMWFFAGVMQALNGGAALRALDIRLHNCVPLFRSTGMTRFMLALTEAGSPAVLWVVCVGTALIALSYRKGRLAATFILAVAGTGLLSVILKATIGHARPMDAMIAAREASFPSGHMLSGAVVYGLFAWVLLRTAARPAARAIGTALILLFVVGIGLSRLYLGVHWPSDLLGSLALALACLGVLLFFLHYERPLPRIDGFSIPLRPSVLRVVGIVVLIASVATGVLMLRHTKMVVVAGPAAVRPVSTMALLAGLPADVPRRSQGLLGEQMEPISIVMIGAGDRVVSAFERGGWTLADLPTPIRVMKESLAVVGNHPDPSGPATPAFLGDRPQTFTFEKPDAAAPGVRRRHHTRVWRTSWCADPGCVPVWAATASFDIGVELSAKLHLPTHRIDPNIDQERVLIVADLTRAGAREIGTLTVVPPLRGTNAAGDAFTTDGRAAVVAIP